MKTSSLAILLCLLIGGYSAAHAFQIVEGAQNIFWDSEKAAKLDEGNDQVETMPDDFHFLLDETKWNKEPWEILLNDGIIKNLNEGNKLHTLNGKPLSAYAYHPSGIIVGTSDPRVTSARINQVSAYKAKGLEALVIFKENHKLVEPDMSNIGFYDFKYNPIPFKKRTLKEAIRKISVILLLDRSGSMGGYLGEATKAAKTFVKNLPASVKCSVQSFNTTFQDMAPQGLECKNVWRQLAKPKASGGSSIYTALLKAYDTAISQAATGQKTIVIMLTDGGNTDRVKKSKVIKARKRADAVTFIYWIGPVNKTDLSNVANYELTGNDKIGDQLNKYFSSIEAYIAGQLAFRMNAPTKTVDGIAQLKTK